MGLSPSKARDCMNVKEDRQDMGVQKWSRERWRLLEKVVHITHGVQPCLPWNSYAKWKGKVCTELVAFGVHRMILWR